MSGNMNTIKFKMPKDKQSAHEVLMQAYSSMKEKGYDPVNQIVGYLLSGDPTYITSYNNSRGKIARMNRDEIIEELVHAFVEYHHLEDK